MEGTYTLEVAGIKRELILCPISDSFQIASFVILGDVELTTKCASELIKKVPEFDVLITAEAKGIPLVHEIARQLGIPRYIIARKSAKVYMKDPYSVSLKSITTGKEQELYIDKTDMPLVKDKRVLIVDDVISTGQSLQAVKKLVIQLGGIVAGTAAILAEGDAKYRDDIIYLEYLPMFDMDGNRLD